MIDILKHPTLFLSETSETSETSEKAETLHIILDENAHEPSHSFLHSNLNIAAAPTNLLNDNIVLIGMMGSGKTTIGKALAKYLSRSFLDLDHEIESHCGTDVSTIFALEGEAGFRRRETEILKKILQTHPQKLILATGGGAILQSQNQSLLKENGLIIYLNATVDELWQRTRYDKRRPLLANTDPLATLEKIYQERLPIYQKLADFCVDTMHNQLDRVLIDITKILSQNLNSKKV